MHKFGSFSLAGAGQILHLRSILEQFGGHHLVILAPTLEPRRILQIAEELNQFHNTLDKEFVLEISRKLDEMAKIASDVEVLSAVELLISQLVACVCGGVSVDSRELVFLMPGASETLILVDWKKSKNAIRSSIQRDSRFVFIPGSFCTSSEGTAFQLPRKGSDHLAAVIANLVDADSLTVWKEYDGFFTADPCLVREAKFLPVVSYEEAAEFATVDSQVLHPIALSPIIKKEIPLIVRNAFNLPKTGTLISRQSDLHKTCKAFSLMEDVTLIAIEGFAMINVEGVAARVFAAVAKSSVSVVMIALSSSEQSLCFAVKRDHSAECRTTISSEFAVEFEEGTLWLREDDSLAIITAIGDGIQHQWGTLGKLASALARMKATIRSIAQSSSRRSITFVIEASKARDAINALHDEVYHTTLFDC